MVSKSPPSSRGRSRRRRGARRRRSPTVPRQAPARRLAGAVARVRAIAPQMGMAGTAFLKCAFAAPDFAVDPGMGIPDHYHGRTICLKDNLTDAISFTAGKDTYLIVAPVPGYAYFKAEVNPGAVPTVFTGVPYSTYDTNFGTANGGIPGASFTKYRYASNIVGLYPTSNLMQFAGGITSWKVDAGFADDLTLGLTQVGLNITSITLPITTGLTSTSRPDFVVRYLQGFTGFQQVLAPRDNYADSFIKGIYAVAADKSGDFEWSNFCTNETYEASPIGVSPASVALNWDGARALQGYGNLQTTVIKVAVPSGAVNSAILKIWTCMEMQVNTASNLYQFAHLSPSYDGLALAAYRKAMAELPVAVPCSQNAGFWSRVLDIIRGFAKAGSYVPGPIGLFSSGVGNITDALAEMTM